MYYHYDPSALTPLRLIWNARERTTGLPLIFYLLIAAAYLPGALILYAEWYEYYPRDWTFSGFVVVTLAINAATLGCFMHELLRSFLARRRRIATEAHLSVEPQSSATEMERIAIIVVSFGVFVITAPLLLNLTFLRAVISSLTYFIVPGAVLFAAAKYREKNRLPLSLYGLPLLLIPISTVFTGHLGTGAIFASCFFVGCLCMQLMNRKLLVLAPLVLYSGVSLFVNYMEERGDIRAEVWGGATLDRRISSFSQIFERFEWFNSSDYMHLRHVDSRLNSAYLIGAMNERFDRNQIEHLHGTTLALGFVAWIPRALWPNKPVTAGSGNYVSDATGLDFDSSTSVGMGYPFELYYNFGAWGVVFGMALLGAVIKHVDRLAVNAFKREDFPIFVVWYAMGLIIASANLVAELVSSSAALAIVSFAFIIFARRLKGIKQ
jgi:hypothetical protein